MSNTMREILFRGKRTDNGEWVKGIYYPVEHTGFSIPGGIDYYIITRRPGGCKSQIQVIPETIGQYTGLTDKNGNKIFEGDIVTYDKYTEDGGETREKGTVYWCDGAFWVENVQDEEDGGSIGALVVYQLEIIGNIYDNFELLEGSNG